MKKHFFAAVACLLLSICVAAPTLAEDGSTASIKLTPVSNYFTIKANDVQNYTFKIENTGTKGFSFKTYTAPYNVIGENYEPDFSESNETSYNQIARWISFKDPTNGNYVKEAIYSVNPGEEVTVEYRVSVPSDIPEGSQQCVIFAETINNDILTGASIRTISRVAHIVLGHGLGETKDFGEVTDFSTTGFFTTAGINASAKIKNNGNIDILAAYTFRIETLFGKNIYEDSDTYTMFPETERKTSSTWENAPLFGVFKMYYMANAGGHIQEKSHIVIIMPVFMMIIAAILLTVMVIWIILLIKKRKERKSRLVI